MTKGIFILLLSLLLATPAISDAGSRKKDIEELITIIHADPPVSIEVYNRIDGDAGKEGGELELALIYCARRGWSLPVDERKQPLWDYPDCFNYWQHKLLNPKSHSSLYYAWLKRKLGLRRKPKIKVMNVDQFSHFDRDRETIKVKLGDSIVTVVRTIREEDIGRGGNGKIEITEINGVSIWDLLAQDRAKFRDPLLDFVDKYGGHTK